MIWFALVVFVGVAAVPSPPLNDNGTYRSPALHNYRASFLHKYVVRGGHIYDHRPSEPFIAVDATAHSGHVAHEKAALIVSHQTKNMPQEVFEGLTKSRGVGVFAKEEKLIVYPENAFLTDTANCHGTCSGQCSKTCTFDGRKYEDLPALSASRSVVVNHSVMCDNQDDYAHHENVLVHEFGHLTMAYMPKSWNTKIRQAYAHAKANHLWKGNTYAMANADEYWAEATSAWFMTIIRTDVTGGLNMCGTSKPCTSEMASRNYIKQHDRQLYDALSYAYTDNRPNLPGYLRPCI